MNQRGLKLGACLAVVLLAIGAGLAWRFILRPSVVDLPRVKNSISMEFVQAPAGTFTMGSPQSEADADEIEEVINGDLEKGKARKRDPEEAKPITLESDEDEHEVEITRPFFLGAHEVTQGQFRAVMGPNPLVFTRSGIGTNPELPVENVSYSEAVEFCKKLSELPAEKEAGRRYRLPTEAEWEYACRAGVRRTPFHCGDQLSPEKANSAWASSLRKRDYAKGKRSDLPTAEPVGSYPPNAWGLYDMHGNVWEWCSDWYAADYYKNSPKQDPAGPKDGEQRVARGGSWASRPYDCRSANRLAVAPDVRLGMGLRVVMVQEGK
jgi:formylglycine-generating enzyme required for sulfatase activity